MESVFVLSMRGLGSLRELEELPMDEFIYYASRLDKWIRDEIRAKKRSLGIPDFPVEP